MLPKSCYSQAQTSGYWLHAEVRDVPEVFGKWFCIGLDHIHTLRTSANRTSVVRRYSFWDLLAPHSLDQYIRVFCSALVIVTQ